MLDSRKALLLSLGVGFIAALLTLGLPLLLGYSGCSVLTLIGLCNTQALLDTSLLAILTFTLIVGAAGYILFEIWMHIPRSTQYLIAVAILAVGLLLFQPELDAVGALGLAFSIMGAGPVRRR